MLRVNRLSYSINGQKILNDLSFKIARGDFVALSGPNGSGKTTLIKVLSGVIGDYAGTATLNLLHINRLKPRGLAQTVAVVPQETFFIFPFSALEVVLMGRHPYQNGFAFDSIEDYQIARRAMEATDCWQFRDRNIQTLSGGEKQRVLLARALAQKPKILLLDEPASHLDLGHQRDLFCLLSELNRKGGITLLTVVHDLNMASLHAQKVFFLKQGRLEIHGPTAEVLTDENIQKTFDVSVTSVSTADGKRFFVPQ